MNNCTLCIGDNSAVITDFLSCNCPIAIFKTTEHVIVSKAEIAYEDFAMSGVLYKSLKSL